VRTCVSLGRTWLAQGTCGVVVVGWEGKADEEFDQVAYAWSLGQDVTSSFDI